ncbi:MAG: ABC transporter ATP-binding protein [Chloroflexi bacterium]|nr:ABC transporter ATP-binding protein [Chloroflexota bacterium]
MSGCWRPTLGDKPLLTFQDVVAGYGRVEILHGVSLHINAGEVLSIIGPNGAGKSTILKSIMGLVRPSRGHVFISGSEITGLRPDLAVRRGIGYVPQGRIVFPRMTVQENLDMGAFTIRGRAKVREALEKVFTLFPILAERRRQRADTLSGGEQQMLAMGRALMTEPKLLLLDEPSLGLAPKFVDLVFDKILELRATAGTTMVMVEQNAARALGISDRGYVLELGRNRFEGAGRELLEDPRVRKLYLGG